jgi:hypothetical protein
MNHSKGKIPASLTREQLRALISDAISNIADRRNPETFHALFGHVDRGLQTDDVLHGLEIEWKFERPPQFNEFHWQWKYYIATESVDGDAITVIIAVDTIRKEFEVVTRWRAS